MLAPTRPPADPTAVDPALSANAPQLVGAETPRRRRRVRYELISCALGGHALSATDAARLRPEDGLYVREDSESGLRWHRCLRCDAWLPLAPPRSPARELPPPREEILLPLRGRTLRDRYVLRLIALDKFLHFLILSALAVGVLIFAANRPALSHSHLYRALNDLQGATGGPSNDPHPHGFLYELRRLFSLKQSTLVGVAAAAAVYGLLEGLEGVGLWLQKRWGEYLTFIATGVFIPLEIFELTHKLTVFKVIAFIINVAIVAWLLFNKRLFGLRGGWRAELRERELEMGWPALEARTPGFGRGSLGRLDPPPAAPAP